MSHSKAWCIRVRSRTRVRRCLSLGGNVVNPDQFVNKYGADTFRMFLMFMGPYNEGGDWSDRGITGVFRFLSKVYDLFASDARGVNRETGNRIPATDSERVVYRKLNQLIKKVTEDTEQFHFNTAIAAMMEFMNDYTGILSTEGETVSKEMKDFVLRNLNVLLAPFAPHLSEELNEMRGNKKSIFISEKWVNYDPSAVTEENVTLVIQVNGKIRSKLEIPINSDDENVKALALAEPNVKRYLEGKEIVKAIVVKNKLVNFVIR